MEWARSSNQDAAMFLLDYEKAYDRVEWEFIIMMLESFSFPGEFCQIVKVLLHDASAQIDINGSLSPPIVFSLSIRQGCPLAPSLFVIAFDALFYLLRDSTISPKVEGIRLPDNNELLNIQFADDTALFLNISKLNLDNLNLKAQFFSSISGAKISQTKSTFLSWNTQPPDWFDRSNYQWGGPNKIVWYLGVPFSISPSLKDMWLWVKGKINNKINKWNNRFLSLAGRIQVCQKILSTYSIYYSSTWMFSNYQILEIQKGIRRFLWSDGKGNSKAHSVRWNWCHAMKELGGLGLKDLKIQGIALVAKWIFHALDGHEPWKVLVKSNIERAVPRRAKSWKGLPLTDLVAGSFSVSVQGSCVFRSIWKAWEHIRRFLVNTRVSNDGHIHGERSLWWNLTHHGKPLALIRGCSARSWDSKGVKCLADILEHGSLISWEDLSARFNIPPAQKRTYNLIMHACTLLGLPKDCDIDSHRFLAFGWADGTPLTKTKARNIYSLLAYDTSIISHVNMIWYSNFSVLQWKKNFSRLWKNAIDPKVKCFKWLLTLNRLPLKGNYDSHDTCSICKMPETGWHIFFECSVAREVSVVLNLERNKLRRFLRDGHATMFVYELKGGLDWRRNFDDLSSFEHALRMLNNEIRDNRQPSAEHLEMLSQIQDRKNIVWMEGPQGWTAWVEHYNNILS
ncbi:uncharacterized protein LOC131858872 [Cryptomeria japonica]|uniref:uncharacterized protein LOC131858872 n=1 Tax=Cryptomeria japonica TaxID=3369 RepID=UPI0027DA1F7F|nr:uncharacterized protein LOC131858872 [Cryptomeria japonica]